MTEHTHKQPMRAHRIYENAAALGACEAERDRLKAVNAGLVEALESIAANTCCGPCQEAALVARNAIAKATKETKENVAIFTAAPDLIRVLGKAIPALILLGNYIGNEWHGGGGIESFDRCAIIGEARAILAKAKREAP